MKSKGKTTDALQMQIYLGRNLFRFLQNSGDKKSSLLIFSCFCSFWTSFGAEVLLLVPLASLQCWTLF